MIISLLLDVLVGYFLWVEYKIMDVFKFKIKLVFGVVFIFNCGVYNDCFIIM